MESRKIETFDNIDESRIVNGDYTSFTYSGMKVESVGSIVSITGNGWLYEQMGFLHVFTQTGKIKSLRNVKVKLKSMGYLSIGHFTGEAT